MTRPPLHRIYRVALLATLCAIFMGIALLLYLPFEGLSPAEEILGASGSNGELPQVW